MAVLPFWPPGVPYKPLAGDFALAQSSTPPARTEMAAGNVRMRPTVTVQTASLRLSIKMTSAQFETFRAWVRDTLVQGSSKFTMPVLTGAGMVERTCYLADGTFSARQGRGWVVSFNLAVEGL